MGAGTSFHQWKTVMTSDMRPTGRSKIICLNCGNWDNSGQRRTASAKKKKKRLKIDNMSVSSNGRRKELHNCNRTIFLFVCKIQGTHHGPVRTRRFPPRLWLLHRRRQQRCPSPLGGAPGRATLCARSGRRARLCRPSLPSLPCPTLPSHTKWMNMLYYSTSNNKAISPSCSGNCPLQK